MSSSDISSLSSTASIDTDEELLSISKPQNSLDRYFKKDAGRNSGAQSPLFRPKKKRAPSPPHETVLADNPNIAFIVMFRSRFSSAFPKSLPHFGPQDIERGVREALPDEHVERLLCALIGLVLNRKKDIERGHFQRALEEAVSTHAHQWPPSWEGKNPLHGGSNFHNMDAAQRLNLLKTLILWSLNSSEAVQAILKESYKQQRHEDDLNQPLSVQPWGRDGDKRRYWLIEGQDDTHFRLYRESNPALKHNTWWTVAGSIDELKAVATKLGEEGTQAARRLQERITLAVPRFEASEEKRKRRDYRLARKAQFIRPEPGFSLYEGRTRGKRIRYTFSDEEEGTSDAFSSRRSNRHSGISTPAEPAGPTFTASGRQVKSRVGGAYGELVTAGKHNHEPVPSSDICVGDRVNGADNDVTPRTRSRRSAQSTRKIDRGQRRSHIEGYNALDEMEDESDASSSGGDWDGDDGDDDVDGNIVDDEEDDADMSDSGNSADEEDFGVPAKHSLVVSLRYAKKTGDQSVEASTKVEGHSKVNGFVTPPATSSILTNGDKLVSSKVDELNAKPIQANFESDVAMQDTITLESKATPAKLPDAHQSQLVQDTHSILPHGFSPPTVQNGGPA